MSRTRRTFTAQFKAKLILEVLKGEKNINTIAAENDIVSTWCDMDGFRLRPKKVEEKPNEITAIPQLLDVIQVKGSIITIDATGTQTEIAEKIKQKHRT